MKILFQGDSITDAGRDQSDYHNMGNGYPLYASKMIKEFYPDMDFEFINLGISGDRTESLQARWDEDCIKIRPDILSIMIGINDTWHFADTGNWKDNDIFEDTYRSILTRAKNEINTKIIMMEQFLLPVKDKEFFRIDLDPKIQIVRKLAREFADIFIPMDGIFAAACVQKEAVHWALDGVHPTEEGSKLIAKQYLKAFIQINK